jgi:signal transduction histidine kinase
MSSPDKKEGDGEPLAFDITPQVVFRLGDELISDELQALVELVKNSYDASATTVEVQVDSHSPVRLRRSPKTPGTKPTGWLEVRDDGDGMTLQEIDNGWLLISTSTKREMKETGKRNRLGRTPLGDKGLGRLGVLRLGVQVEIRTRPRRRAEEHILRFARSDFEREHALSDVQPHHEQRPLAKAPDTPVGWCVATPFADDVDCTPIPGRQGTTIRITALNNPDVWRDRVRIQQELLALISPFHEIEQFALNVHLDDPREDEPLSLGQIAELRRDLADVRWSFQFDGKQLEATGRVKLAHFKPAASNRELTQFWETHVAPDHGGEYLQRLVDGPLRERDAHPPGAPWWLALKLSIELSDIPAAGRKPKTHANPSMRSAWVSPGPFSGEIDSFRLGRDVEVDSAVFASPELYSRWVRDVRGVKIYRDGFGIRVNDDFLGLGAGFTGARSFWALRPGNVVGYIALSAGANAQLQETTDREGFVANNAYQTFHALLRTLVERIDIVQSQIGRELTGWAQKSSPVELRSPSVKAAELARAAADREESTRRTIAAVEGAKRTLVELGEGSALLTPEQTRQAREGSELLTGLGGLVADSESLRGELEQLAASSRQLEDERTQLQEQLRAAYQTVGLGIVAETVAHEMTNIAGRLQARASALAPQLKGPEHRGARTLVSDVKSAVRAIRSQLRHLEPQLRYQRTRRENVDVLGEVKETAAYHRERLEPAGITVDLSGKPFHARLNPGRLQQALDNLLINSEFWLRHAGTEQSTIQIEVSEPLITVRDNGPGVDPGLENAVFEPFVTGRGGRDGRGLGLFIARQVLGDDHITIRLGERESDGRRRSFVLDLTGASEETHDA